uniref:peptide MFS transporter n=1 Tax=Saccharopolyspora galaxeae TaxID=2781241 RepID=UPI0027DB2479|nr:peptide MFS transporter [Saccharopolyspora sp. HNM0986]
MADNTVADAPQRGFFGQPRGLSTLFFTEMWERFSYYGMRGILALYLMTEVSKGGLGLPEGTATSTVQAYGASVYLTGVAGGWLADRLLGARHSVFYGGVLIMFGHIGMALPGGLTSAGLGIVLIIAGSGLLKPNVSKMVGDLYSAQDQRRDAGFSVFYMGINLGGFFGPLIAGFLQSEIGFHWGFGAAAVGMALGLIQYVLGRRNLGTVSDHPGNPLPEGQKGRVLTRAVGIAVLFVVVLGGLVATGSIGLGGLVNVVSVISAVLPVVYFAVMLSSKQITKVERDRLIAYIPLFLATALFFLLFEQQASTLVRVTEEDTAHSVLGWEFPVAWFQSINSLAIIILAPVFAALWLKLGSRQPSTPAKFVGGVVFVGLGFLWVVLSGFVVNSDGQQLAIMVALVFVILTIGELMLSPVGLSASTKLAPAAFSSQTLGLYFLAPALGQGLGAQVVKLYSPENQALYFGVIGVLTIACGGLLAVSVPWVRRMMHGVP